MNAKHKPTHNRERATQDAILIGNLEDKANLRNPLARRMVAGFDASLFRLTDQTAPKSIHEVGCGEGRLTEAFAERYPVPVRASDFSREIIDALRSNQSPDSRITWLERSIYELDPREDSADLVVCCEVLEHLERPDDALERLRALRARHYVLSVPREPLWRMLNMARGKYWGSLGNTPGHLNHWSVRSFATLLEQHGFEIAERRQPLPWTMVLARIAP